MSVNRRRVAAGALAALVALIFIAAVIQATKAGPLTMRVKPVARCIQSTTSAAYVARYTLYGPAEGQGILEKVGMGPTVNVAKERVTLEGDSSDSKHIDYAH